MWKDMVATEKIPFLRTRKENIKKVANFLQHLNMLTSYIQKKKRKNKHFCWYKTCSNFFKYFLFLEKGLFFQALPDLFNISMHAELIFYWQKFVSRDTFLFLINYYIMNMFQEDASARHSVYNMFFNKKDLKKNTFSRNNLKKFKWCKLFC